MVEVQAKFEKEINDTFGFKNLRKDEQAITIFIWSEAAFTLENSVQHANREYTLFIYPLFTGVI